MLRSSGLVAAMLMLAACEAKIETGDEAKGTASAAGKAEAGTLSIDAPGFDMKLKIPEVVRAEIGGDADLVYPGATLGGLHVEAKADQGGGESGSVEMRFTSPDAVDKVAAWYRDPARAGRLKVGSTVRKGAGILLSGTSADGGDPFSLRLTPASGGGTEGRLVLRDRTE